MNDADLSLCRSLLFLPASNERAVAKARTLDADLIVLDLGTPSATEERLEVVRAVRQEAELRAVPVLAITTDIGAARRRRSELKDLGVRVLGLPFDLATLDDRIASLV